MGTSLMLAQQPSPRSSSLEARTAALQEELKRLTASDRRKDEFLATLSHELRNQLAPALNALELMKRAASNAELQERARAILERQSLHLKRLLDDLLDLSRITHHRLDLKPARLNLGTMLQQAVEAARPAFTHLRQTVTLSLPDAPVFLEADPLRLAQVFGNLLGNAGKYSNPGGRIEIVAEVQGSDALVRFRDHGIGISAEQLEQVFEPFRRLPSARVGVQGGLGLGLALARRLVEQQGGSVTARSGGPGAGSEFLVRLPILTRQLLVQMPDPPPARGGPAQLQRLLLVDDNRDAVESLAVLLSLTGYQTRIAYDGLKALQEAASYRPDVVLLDVGLPGLSGLEVCRAIKSEPWGKGMLVIALTGWGQDDDRRRSREAGFDGHLVKPVDFADLTRLLQAATESAYPLFV